MKLKDRKEQAEKKHIEKELEIEAAFKLLKLFKEVEFGDIWFKTHSHGGEVTPKLESFYNQSFKTNSTNHALEILIQVFLLARPLEATKNFTIGFTMIDGEIKGITLQKKEKIDLRQEEY